MNAFIKGSGQPVRLYTVDELFIVATATKTFAVRGCALGAPDEQFILFAANLHGQTTDDFKILLMQQCLSLIHI